MALTQCMAVATTPGLRTRPASTVSGCSFLNVVRQLGSPVISTSKRSPSGPKVQAGSRCSSPISQLTVAVTTGAPSTVASPVNRLAPPVPRRPRLYRADRRVDRSGGHRHLVGGPQLGLDVEAHLVGDHEDRLAE